MIGLEEDIAQSMERAMIFADFMDSLFKPTPAQLWLERAAADLERQRDPDGEKKAKRDKLVISIMERDGSDCWFCGRPLGGDVTLEHLQPLALGGNWDESNLALAHRGCNKVAGHLSRIKKEALREQRINEQPRDGSASNKPLPRKS